MARDDFRALSGRTRVLTRYERYLGRKTFGVDVSFKPDRVCRGARLMITRIEGTCRFEGCDKPATHVACGRATSAGGETGHPEPACYCEGHAAAVVNEDSPEYSDKCPNCGCHFGVN